MSKKEGKKLPKYLREQGDLGIKEPKKRKITFSLTRHIAGPPGQSFKEWDDEGLMAVLATMMQYAGQFTTQEVIQEGCIKLYNKFGYPPHSEFPKPKHISVETWAVMHITANSKEVVAGYIEDNVFYIVFLDKNHVFWPMADK
ncbi:hypothetical protein SAMN05444266_101285 [Chitinophaga jiangningensis]|uniref:Uncharacterized protein n=1 Tax=Chitinophaga jiangningensis TaxID=1419482 RepID=A0A1M6VN12_9BACT|nr:hypothetical protein [Chitinophaga jiangningensis]SHK82957.1 hypothetical protein SAMN05444266_101285 [Chitinophaga jiangningensis]